MRSSESDQPSDRLRLAALLGLVAASFLLGGASRNDVIQLVVLQPIAVICLGIFLISPGAVRWNAIRVPLGLLAAIAGLAAVQLVPLPPAIWASLPGHGQFTSSAQVIGLEAPWRPLSLVPDLTLSSLVGLIVPLAALIGFASVSEQRTRLLLPCLLLGATLSALLGLAQLAGGAGSPLYLFSITNAGSPVGFFSNRNHQAALLVITWPMLALWASTASESRLKDLRQMRRWIAGALAILLLPMILVIGSRAGVVLGVIGLAAAAVLWRHPSGRERLRDKLALPIFAVGAGAVLLAAVLLSRDEAVQRITGMDSDSEGRLEYLPTLLKMAGDFFPVGSGFGGFDPLYRVYEPHEYLSPSYLNHAHNELMELAIQGGLPGLIILAVFLFWLAARGWAVFRGQSGTARDFGRLGFFMVTMLLLASLVDYPLRTPLLGAVFAIATGWLSGYGSSERPAGTARAGEKSLPNSSL